MTERNIKDFDDDELVSMAGSGMPSKQSWAQAELTRKLMVSIRDLDKSTSRYSTVLIVLTLTLFVVAALQLIVSIFAPFEVVWQKFAIFVLVVGTISFAFWRLVKDFLK